MDISPAALVNAATQMQQSQVAQTVQVLVLKKAMDIQATGALALLSQAKNIDTAQLTDVIPAMLTDVLASGLSPKAWRVLAANGLKKLLPSQFNHSPWEALILNLKALSASRWPALAPRGIFRLLHDSAGRPDSYDTARAGVAGWFWEIICNEASALRGETPAYKELFDSVPRWAWLVRKYAFSPDKNQRRRGCVWLREAVQSHEILEQSVNVEESPAWAQWIESAQWNNTGKLTVVPLLSPHALVAESMTLHNCPSTTTGSRTRFARLPLVATTGCSRVPCVRGSVRLR